MRKSGLRKRLILAGLAAAILGAIPLAAWLSLTHQPTFYRALAEMPRAQREAKARHFVANSLQLRNDISNERAWQAVFSDGEVNAWLAEDLIKHFADLVPPEVHEPRIAFESDRITLAFQLDRGPIRSVIWVVAAVKVPEDNVLSLTLEKIRAGVVPISADRVIAPLTAQALEHGLEIRWARDQDLPVATIRFQPGRAPSDFVLERLNIRRGQIRLSGRSERITGTAATPTLPTRRILQLNFPRRNRQVRRPSSSSLRNSTTPTS